MGSQYSADRLLLGLRLGDPEDEVLGPWLAKESVRDNYLAPSWADAQLMLGKTIAGCFTDQVPEIRSLGNTLKRWRGRDPPRGSSGRDHQT